MKVKQDKAQHMVYILACDIALPYRLCVCAVVFSQLTNIKNKTFYAKIGVAIPNKMQYTPHYRGVTCVKLSGTLENIRKLMAMSDIQDVRPNVGRWCLREDEVYWLVGMILKAPFTFSSHLSV